MHKVFVCLGECLFRHPRALRGRVGGVCSRKRRVNSLDAEMVINLAELIIILAESVIIFAELIINFAEIPSTIPSMVISACKYASGVYVSDAELWQCKSRNDDVKNKFNTTL